MLILTHTRSGVEPGEGGDAGGGDAPGLVSLLNKSDRIAQAHGAGRGASELTGTFGAFERLELEPQESRLRRMREGVRLAARLAEATMSRDGFRPGAAWMATLTYALPDAWEPRHVSACLDSMRRWARRGGHDLAGVWVAEMQDRRYEIRGELAIHYHVLVWLPRGVTLPKPDKQGWWRHGMSKVERVRWSGAGYISKYASKGTHAPLPKGARVHASFGLAGERARYTWLRRPRWLRELVEVGTRLRRRVGGGFLELVTGEVFVSPWRVTFAHGRVILTRKELHA